MTSLAIIQIIYLALNIIGTIVGLIWLCTSIDLPFIEKLLEGSSKRWMQIMLSIFEILLVILFMPAIAILTIVSLVLVIIALNFGVQVL